VAGLDLRADARSLFWDAIDQQEVELNQSLRQALGVYVFSERVPYSHVPWYVGQSGTGFQNEVFSGRNCGIFHHIFQHDFTERRLDNAVIFLLARVTPTGRLSMAFRPREFNFVEQEVIRHALRANGQLKNSAGAGLLRDIRIEGIINTQGEEKSMATRRLRKALGLSGAIFGVVERV